MTENQEVTNEEHPNDWFWDKFSKESDGSEVVEVTAEDDNTPCVVSVEREEDGSY